MVEIREVLVEGTGYQVVLSDEKEALIAAKAAGSAFAAVGTEYLDADYAVETIEAADERFLERLVRRHLGLPWNIAESERIRIREIVQGDWERFREWDSGLIFADQEQTEAYIQSQYRFYEYGVWAVVRREDERLIGAAGVYDLEDESGGVHLELGYEIFPPYRRQGYAREACQLILDYIVEEYQCPVWASVHVTNAPSRALLEKLGFVRVEEGDVSETRREHFIYRP
ncbi:MAG: GNAT family N-acetyltransferase [Clostridiales bacterium]|nr:GNAT family N-acetyltransferase [Clostridiales bacterium]